MPPTAMGEGNPSSPTVEKTAARSLHHELTDACDNNVPPASPTSPPPPKSDCNGLHASASPPSVHDGDQETPEIAPTTGHRSEPLQNGDASSTQTNGAGSNAIEGQTVADCIPRPDSCLSEPPRHPRAAAVVPNEDRVLIPEARARSPEEILAASIMSEVGDIVAQPSMQAIRPAGPASSTDARSIAARSIGDRSLFAVSTISPEDEVLSLRVRSLYDSGLGGAGSDASSQLSSDIAQRRISSIIEENAVGVSRMRGARSSFPGASKEVARRSRIGGSVEDLAVGSTPTSVAQEATIDSNQSSAARGIEDWEDLEGHDVDRYGFINNTYISSSAPTPHGTKAVPKRVATALFLQSKEPRKRPLALKTLRLSPSAPEMLKSPLPERSIVMRDKENTRSRKWRGMAVHRKSPEKGTQRNRGSGAEWSFVTTDTKLINRTWKGIPDCWRGAAWHAFLSASAKTRGIGKSDVDLIDIYNDLLERPSSDDVQIDLDVPRTISSHIMFRRRYRGGQRLLFRVLHSLALYFPDVGYVQGMASIAATILCYYDEEKAFVMMVRLWELRGLGKLYQSGFEGLMAALEEFESTWMKGNQISKKLINLGIGPTAYGTRWYLTLFNYSIPFAAQLRVWDVFMLLGDPDPDPGSRSHFHGTLDVLHATSAAILDGLKTIILKSDFEDAMKNLTSFIPVKDEDMLMKVVKAEWKMRKRKFGNHF